MTSASSPATPRFENPMRLRKCALAVGCFLWLSVSVTLPVSVQAQLAVRAADSIEAVYSSDRLPEARFDSNTAVGEYLAYAAIGNPGLRRAFYSWKAALARTGYAGAWADPMLTYSRFIEQVETRVGPQNQKFGIKQMIPWPGTLGAKKSIAAGDANKAYRQYQARKLRLFHSVRSAYYDFYFLGRHIELTRQNLELLTFWESVARVRYKVALKQHPDIIKAQVELGMLEDRLLTLQDQTVPAASRLRAILNLADTVALAIPAALEVIEFAPDRDRVMQAVQLNNPDLKSLAHVIESRRAGERLAGLRSRPAFTFGVDYIETGPALNAATPESGKDPWAVGVSINLPLWFGKNSARKRESQAHLRAAELNYDDARNQLTASVDQLLFQYQDALRKLRLYRDGLIPKAEQALNANFTAYQAGETDFLNLLDAQRQLLAFQLEFEKAQTDLAVHHSALEVLIGGDLEDLNPNNHTEGVH